MRLFETDFESITSLKNQQVMDSLNFNSVEDLPCLSARAIFKVNSSSVFKEDVDIVATVVDDKLSYIPWGGDNQMPFDILDLIEKDETLATCQCFNAEVCYGSGLRYDTRVASASVKNEVEDFLLDNDLASYFLGVSQDFKHFGFAVSVLILNEDGTKVVSLKRKEACYCRFAPADASGTIPKILYANWRKVVSSRTDIEVIDLLDPASPWRDLQDNLAKGSKTRKFAVLSRIPTVDSTYYPIPYYAALFKGKWYNIKQLIGIAKEAKLKNHAPIKYQIEISAKYCVPRASPTATSNRSASFVRNNQFLIFSPARKTAAKPGSPLSTSLLTARSSTTLSSIRLTIQRRVAIGKPTFRKLSI